MNREITVNRILRWVCIMLCSVMLFPSSILAEDESSHEGETAELTESYSETSGETIVAEPVTVDYPSSAAAVAAMMREGMVDVTGNGMADETDALALLMHLTGGIPDLSALPELLQGSILGEKYLDSFLYTGVEHNEHGYRSSKICFTLTTVKQTKLTYYVADILVRDINCFRTQFGGDRYGLNEKVVQTANRNNAIIAVNGDFFRYQKTGLVIRNGILYRDTKPKDRDACVLYYDGVMECYAPSEVDKDEIMQRGAYQSWQFGPSLLEADGSPKTARSQFRTDVYGINPRTAIGYVEPGHYMLVVVDGRREGGSYGLDMAGLAKLMSDLGCKVAYNLDGGGTSVMTSSVYGVISNRCNEGRKCSDIIMLVEE